MKNSLTLEKRIDEFMKKKEMHCKCNPCTCSKRTKDQYFQELKGILKRFNTEKFASHSFMNVIEK